MCAYCVHACMYDFSFIVVGQKLLFSAHVGFVVGMLLGQQVKFVLTMSDSYVFSFHVMGYALQFGVIAHKRIHYYYYYKASQPQSTTPPFFVCTSFSPFFP